MARPKKYDINDIIIKLNKYIAETDDPLIQEFCLNYEIGRTRFYDFVKENEELSNTVKKCIDKQQVYMIRGCSKGELNPTFTIFRLKQPCHSWEDKTKHQIEIDKAKLELEKRKVALAEQNINGSDDDFHYEFEDEENEKSN